MILSRLHRYRVGAGSKSGTCPSPHGVAEGRVSGVPPMSDPGALMTLDDDPNDGIVELRQPLVSV
jgi:hypothetical protein